MSQPLPPVRREAFTMREVSVILNVCDETIRKMVHAGKIHAVRVGPRMIRIPRSEVARLAANRVRPRPVSS